MSRTSQVHYISPSAISIMPNCNNSANDLAVYVADGAKIKVYSKGTIDFDNNVIQEWTLKGRNRRLADSNKPYTIYARLSKTDKDVGYIVFAPKTMNGNEWTDKYNYLTPTGITAIEGAITDYNNWYIYLGYVTLPENGLRTLNFDTGILGTDQYNMEWAENPDQLPIRVEIGCVIDDEDAGPTPYVYWGQELVLSASLMEGWANTDIERFDHWTIARNTGNEEDDNAWALSTGAVAFQQAGSIILSHERGPGDDFNGAVSTIFTVTAWGNPEEPVSGNNPQYTKLAAATINIHAETAEKYELALSSIIASYNPQTETYSPAGGVNVRVRATDQRGEVFELTQSQFTNAGIKVQYAVVETDTWVTLVFDGPSTAIATSNIPVTVFAAQKSLNVRIASTDERQVMALGFIAFVRDGEDSRDREWIFFRSTSPVVFGDASSEHPRPSLINIGEVEPEGAAGGETAYDNTIDGWVPQGWYDEPQGVDETIPYEYASYRNYIRESSSSVGTGENNEGESGTGDNNGGESSTEEVVSGHWGDFSMPHIWNRYATDAVTYDIVPSVSVINSNAAGVITSDGIIVRAYRTKGTERSGDLLETSTYPEPGDNYFAEYSIDGNTWQLCGRFNYVIGETSVSVYGISPTNVRTAQVDITIRLKHSGNINEVLKENAPIRVVKIITEEETQEIVRTYGSDYFLSKITSDTAAGVITFDKGLEAGDWAEGTSGAALWMDDDGLWHFESDFVNIRKKLTATEVAIQDVHHVGGQMLLTAASCKADFVVDKGSYYRVFFLRHDSDGNTVKNLWRVGDQAYCQTFNLTEEDTDNFSNTFYWRLVTGVSTASTLDTGTYEVDGQEVSGSDYHYIDLSKGTAASASDAPSAGDDIVQLGYRGTDDEGRQTAILIAGASADGSSPFIRLFEGIDTFALPSDVEQLKPGDNRLKGVLRMMEGSTLEDGRDINNLGTARGNLLKNTGFTGDFESVEITEESQTITGAMPIYSDPLKWWEASNVTIEEDDHSASGYVANIGVLSQTVEDGFTAGEWYMLSALIYGQVTMEAGGAGKTENVSEWTRVNMAFRAATTSGLVRISGSGKVAEIMLTAGNLPTEWHRASTDNDKSMSEFFGLSYLANAISNASTEVIGGLIMSQILKVGNYRDGQMSQETGGMSGAMNDEKSPFLWGGGSMEDAIYTIMKYANNPAYQPTDAEVAKMAKFVVTHGGRAILSDIILRGYIYALGGSFRNITTPNKTFSIDENGTAVFTSMLVSGIAHFASAIMEGDYMYSQFGVMGASDAPSDDYGLFDLHAPDNINGWRPNFYVNFRTGKVRLFDADIIGTVRSKPIHITDSNSFGRYFSKTGNYYYYNYSSEFDLVPRRSMQLEYLPSDYDTIVCQAFPLELIGIQDVTTEGLTTTIINISGHSYKYYEIENWSNETFKLSTISDKTVAQFQLVWRYKGNGNYLLFPILLSLRDI